MNRIVVALLSLGLVGDIVTLILICVFVLLSEQGPLINPVVFVMLVILAIILAVLLIVIMYKVISDGL